MQQVAKKSPSGGALLNNIISYKRDRLQLPEYDYNMTPADIIRFSNQNFDYERYIRDWVLPYSNSNFYIRRSGGSDLASASAASSSRQPFSVESSYYMEPREEDYANYYKSVGNITTVDVKTDEHRPLAKKPSSSTLEYLDLSDRNPQGSYYFHHNNTYIMFHISFFSIVVIIFVKLLNIWHFINKFEIFLFQILIIKLIFCLFCQSLS